MTPVLGWHESVCASCPVHVVLALLVACFCSVFKLVFVRCFGSSYKLERYTPSFLFHSHPPKERVVDPLVGACGLLEHARTPTRGLSLGVSLALAC